MDTVSYLLGKKNGGGSGTTNYNDLSNKPSINDVTLSGNKTSSDLGIQEELVSGTNIKTINNESILGSGDLVISGGGSSNQIFYSDSNYIIDLRNDTTPGIYLNKNDEFRFAIVGTDGVSYQRDGSFGFFTIIKKYSECNNDEVFMTSRDTHGRNLLYIKATTDYGWNVIYSIETINWVNQKDVLTKDNTTAYVPYDSYCPSTKKYVDDKPTTYTGYDATKTQVLKNINGTLTWVDE